MTFIIYNVSHPDKQHFPHPSHTHYTYTQRHTKYVYMYTYLYPTLKFTSSIRLTDAYHWDDNDAFTFPQLKLCGAWRVGYDDERRRAYNTHYISTYIYIILYKSICGACVRAFTYISVCDVSSSRIFSCSITH